jgi:hypothetical protein
MTMSHYEGKLKTDALDPKAWVESANRLSVSAKILESHFEEFWNQLRNQNSFDDSKVSTLFMLFCKATICTNFAKNLVWKVWLENMNQFLRGYQEVRNGTVDIQPLLRLQTFKT